jgi:hypothetical protein
MDHSAVGIQSTVDGMGNTSSKPRSITNTLTFLSERGGYVISFRGHTASAETFDAIREKASKLVIRQYILVYKQHY